MPPSEPAGFRFGRTIFSDFGHRDLSSGHECGEFPDALRSRMENWLSSLGPDDNVSTSVITRGEVLFGIERLAAGRRRTELEDKASRLFTVIPCEAIPVAAGDRYASLKREQQRRGLPLDENDLWIAATALALGTALVSGDTDFQLIEELNLVRP